MHVTSCRLGCVVHLKHCNRCLAASAFLTQVAMRGDGVVINAAGLNRLSGSTTSLMPRLLSPKRDSVHDPIY